MGLQVTDVKLALAAVKGIVAKAVIGLHRLEQGEHVVIGPDRIHCLAPGVIVIPVSADIDHRIDRTRSAQGFPARPEQPAAIEIGLRLRLKCPIERLALGQKGDAEGHVDQRTAISRAGLEQAHLCIGICRKALGQQTTGRTCSNDNVVKHPDLR